MQDFDTAFELVVGAEQGFTNNAKDNGGATKYGVTIKTLAAWRKKDVTVADVQNLELSEAKDIYRAFYWKPLRGDDLPVGVALLAFDAAINSGVKNSVLWLQFALNGMGESLIPDGIIGDKTIQAAKRYSAATLCSYLVAERLLFMSRHEDFSTFGKGWFRRVALKAIQAGKELA